MARSRSTSRSRASQKSASKSPAAKRGRKSAGATTPAARKASPKRKPSPARVPKTPKSADRPKTPTTTTTSITRKRSLSRSSSTRATPRTAPAETTRPKSPVRPKSKKERHESPVHTPEVRHRRTPSPIFSSTRPRRAAAIAANRELMGTESSRLVSYKKIEPVRSKNILPDVHWPTWRGSRAIRNHFRRNSTFYLILFTLLVGSLISYFLGRKIQKQLHIIQRALVDIYEEQRKRLE